MRRHTSFWLIATLAMLGLGLDSPAASAGEGWGRYSPAYYGPPVYTTSPPAVVYPGPPVYAYSYVSAVEGAYAGRHAYGRTSGIRYYTTRINLFRGPRWDYSAAYYSSPPVRRVAYARHFGRGGVRPCCLPYRAYVRGPIVPTSRPR